MGFSDVRFFFGVVEDRKDPKKLGRVRVRVWGVHSKERVINESTGQGIPVDHLPWAFVMRPTTTAAMDGIGDSPTGLVEGTWVMGISRDGEAMNDLIVIGSLGGMPEEPPFDKKGKFGFVDPRTADEISASPRKINVEENRDPGYPPKDIPMGRYPQEKFLDESDVNRLARGEKTDQTLLKQKEQDLVRAVTTAQGGEWSEKLSPYAAKYPYNHVRETESGHVIEVDDTPDAERIHVWHKEGSYIEMHPDGSIQVKSKGDLYTLVIKDNKLFAEGSIDITAGTGVSVLSSAGGISLKAAAGVVTIDALANVLVTSEGGMNVLTVGPITLNSTTLISMLAPVILANGEPIP